MILREYPNLTLKTHYQRYDLLQCGAPGRCAPYAWTTRIIGFLSERAVCLLFFKAATPRQYPGLPADDVWLKANLFAKDGKTLIYPCAPPPREAKKDPRKK